MNEFRFTCADCGEEKVHVNPNGCGGTGYATVKEGGIEKTVCYDCCGKRDRADMIERGTAVLYLTAETGATGVWTNYVVTNWPGTLKMRVTHSRVGRHNIAGRRNDAWFIGPDGKRWWGWNCGDNQIIRCRRLKSA